MDGRLKYWKYYEKKCKSLPQDSLGSEALNGDYRQDVHSTGK